MPQAWWKACSKGRKAIETHFGNVPLTVQESHENQESGNLNYFREENHFPKRKISNDRSLEEGQSAYTIAGRAGQGVLFKPFLEERVVFDQGRETDSDTEIAHPPSHSGTISPAAPGTAVSFCHTTWLWPHLPQTEGLFKIAPLQWLPVWILRKYVITVHILSWKA